MSKVSIDSAAKFHAYKNFKRGNMKVEVDEEGNAHMYQHGNMIAIKKKDGSVYVTNSGWFSATTKQRLNDVIRPGRITQRDYKWYINGMPWNGRWALIVNGDPISIAVLDTSPM